MVCTLHSCPAFQQKGQSLRASAGVRAQAAAGGVAGQRMLLRRDGFKTELDVRVRGDGIIGLDRSITDADIYNTYAVQPKRAPAFLPLVSSITVDIADRSPLPQCNHGQRSATIGLGEAPRRVPQDVHSESRPTCEPKEPR